uniref:hypothetical protein n=1 Tax=Flavobacterium sp. TaxID=239 RepID=UPI00404ADFC1
MNNNSNTNQVKPINILGIICFLFIISCNNSKEKYFITVDEDGLRHVSKYMIYGNDTLEHGLSKVYENDTLLFLCNYNSGRLHGKFIKYHTNGNIHTTKQYKYGNVLGEQFIYYENEILKQYVLYGIDGKPKFFIEYDDKGTITEWNGNAIADWYIYDNDEFGTKLSNDTLYYGFIVANPPKSERNFKVDLMDVNNGVIMNKRFVDFPENSNNIDIKELNIKTKGFVTKAKIEIKLHNFDLVILDSIMLKW